MDNIVILDSYEVVTDYVFNWTAFWIVTAVCFVICLITYLCTISEVEVLPWTAAMIGIWIVASIIFGAMFGVVVAPIPNEYDTEYKIYINGDIDMNEFIEKYDIIDQDGLIVTVREK